MHKLYYEYTSAVVKEGLSLEKSCYFLRCSYSFQPVDEWKNIGAGKNAAHYESIIPVVKFLLLNICYILAV